MNTIQGDISDHELVALLRSDDIRGLELIYQKYSSTLYRAAFILLKDQAVCEDLIHDLFVDLWIRRDRHHIYELRSYLFTAIRNRVLSHLRSGRGALDIDKIAGQEGDIHTDNFLYVKEINEILNRQIETLPQKCREIYQLSRVEHLPHKEIARLKNISVKTVENQITYALKRIRPALKEFFLLLIAIGNISLQ